MWIELIILILGLVLLWGGAEIMVRYASRLATALGVSPIIVGLTVISIGTSLPEFVVSLLAAYRNTMGISIGNIIGSNIANTGLILGVGALIRTLEVKKSWILREVPAMLFATLVFSIFCWSGHILETREGMALLLLLGLFLFYLYKTSARDLQELEEVVTDEQPGTPDKIKYLLFSLSGILILILGSQLTVTSGEQIARAMGVSDTVIGLTLIAFGTSLPELATTIVGVMRRETDLVVGNVIGSNIFNLLFIGGAVPLFRTIPMEVDLFSIEFPFLIGLSFFIWPLMRFKWDIRRWEGLLLVISYLVFVSLTFI